jgi:hypothetical protein
MQLYRRAAIALVVLGLLSVAGTAVAQAVYPHLVATPVTFRRYAINTTGTMPNDARTVTYSSTAAYIDSMALHHLGFGTSTTALKDTTQGFSVEKVYWQPTAATLVADSSMVVQLNIAGDGATYTADSTGAIVIQGDLGDGKWYTMYTLAAAKVEKTSGAFNFSHYISKAVWFGAGCPVAIRAILTASSNDIIGVKAWWWYPAARAD